MSKGVGVPGERFGPQARGQRLQKNQWLQRNRPMLPRTRTRARARAKTRTRIAKAHVPLRVVIATAVVEGE